MAALLQKIIHLISIQVYSSCYVDVFYKDLNSDLKASDPKIKLNLNIIEEKNLSVFRDIVEEEKLRVFDERFKKGGTVFIAIIGDTVVCYVWISFKGEYEPISGLEVMLSEGIGYIYDTFVLPEFRGRGIHSAVVFQVLEYLKQKKYTGALVIVKRTNIPSVLTFKKFSFKEKQAFLITKILWLKFKSCVWKDHGCNICK